LREQLTLIGCERSQLLQDEAGGLLSKPSSDAQALTQQQHLEVVVRSKFEEKSDSFASFGGPAQHQPKVKEAVTLKGRENFKLQISDETKLSLAKVVVSASGDKNVPKLDLRGIKQTPDYRDWYQYSLKLEESVKFLRQRVKSLEDDTVGLNQKYRSE